MTDEEALRRMAVSACDKADQVKAPELKAQLAQITTLYWGAAALVAALDRLAEELKRR